MNRIYQGRVSRVETCKPGTKGASPDDWQLLEDGENKLWQHHELFQTAVNYYIVALAALGTSPSSKLTQLQGLLKPVWEGFDKKGQRRSGMGESLRRAWQLEATPTLAEAVERFTRPLTDDGVPLETAEKAAEYLLFKLGGDASIRDNGPVFFPMFCSIDCESTFRLSPTATGRAADEARLRVQLHQELNADQIDQLAKSISLASVVYLQPDTKPDAGLAVVERLKAAAKTFADVIPEAEFDVWLGKLKTDFSLPKNRGGNINVKRVHACMLFLAFPNAGTKAAFQSTFPAQKGKKEKNNAGQEPEADSKDETRFIVSGDDPIMLARGTRRFVFPAFTVLPVWQGDGRSPVWKEFDIAAFKEALKVYNQFQQNVGKREDKLNGFATKLLVMDGQQAIAGYAGASELEKSIHARLQKVWDDAKGKPKTPVNEMGEDSTLPRFAGDARIDRLRKIVNDDLAEEYRLTDGRKTPYGLRRRTMKGWGEVKRKWQQIVRVGETFTTERRQKLKEALDDLRGGEKREQIGSHKLFEALIADEVAWSIWREPDQKLQDQINKHEWAADPLEAYREYCEIREALEEVSGRPLNFTPADARYSRRLFMLTEGGSFGKDSGEYRHDAKALAVTVPVALSGEDGRFAAQRCRITYSAPRLLRDRIRSEDGSYLQDWTQPMMRALFGDSEGKANPQELKDAAVQLMPDYDGKGERRVLLNFPMDFNEARLRERIGKASLWEKQFVSWKKGAQLPFLRWETDFDGKEPHRWWQKLSSFSVLAADLGTRHAASIGLIECSTSRDGCSRSIGNAEGTEWFARYRSGTILRLPGENVKVLRPESPLDQDGLGKAFREELYGQRGRPADDAECEETLAMLAALNQSEMLKDAPDVAALKQRFSLPELNDKLLVGLRRTQNWIATCVSWHWKLTQPDNDAQRAGALEQIREQERVAAWRELAGGDASQEASLREALGKEINEQRQRVQEFLIRTTGRILPLRGRVWEWVIHPDKPDCHVLRPTQQGTGPEKVKLRGQRGLSMARIEQISELRRRWQSLNQSLRRKLGEKPLTAAEMRNDPIPDPCPDLLRKLENIREQRVNQTAHLILAHALGLRLREPRLPAVRRQATDMHGEYEVVQSPVDMIVMEDLSRYLSEQGRAKSENTRLMKWCHRAITLKLKMLAEPFGIPVLETPAAYSSRFCSLTGVAGFRAAEIGWNDRQQFRWRVLREENAKALAENKAPSPNAAFAATLFQQLEAISRSVHPNRTLLAPQPGGPLFVTARPVAHPAPSAKRKQLSNRSVLPMQADLNAAANLALRAVAHPATAHIHHRLRTKREKGAKGEADTFLAREPRRFGKEKVGLVLREGDDLPKERNTNLFWDQQHAATFGRARLATEDNSDFPYASGPGLWKAVNDRERQWERCMAINATRIEYWAKSAEPEDDVPM